MKTFVIGDIHGAYKAFQQCLERSGFDSSNDRLIVLGDASDGWPEVKQCLGHLLALNHIDYILGNHDVWAIGWAKSGEANEVWLDQGGKNTLTSYQDGGMPPEHLSLLDHAHKFLLVGNSLFVHAGINPKKKLVQQTEDDLLWERKLIKNAFKKSQSDPSHKFGEFDRIFVGHTPTTNFGTDRPLKLCNVWAMDTGAGWSGRLTIMDIDTEEFWQSDPVPELYPGVEGRQKRK